MKTETKPKDDTLPKATLVTLEDKRARLRAPFPESAYGKLPKPTRKDNPKGNCKECGGWHGLPAVHLDYIGHATVTDRLLEVDPEWNWEPMAFDEGGLPRFIISTEGNPVGLWIWLTVLGVRRPGFGSVESNAFEPEKQLIGDALRNAAMRFGVALDLWSKAELESAALAHEARTGHAPEAPAKPQPPRTLSQAAERAQPPRTVEATPVARTQEKPAQAAPGAPDFQAMPQYHEDGSVTLFGTIVVHKDVIGLWGRWKKDVVISKEGSTSSLAQRTFEEAAEGSPDGKREQALRWFIERAAKDVQEGKKIPANAQRWNEKIAWTLHTMYDTRMRQEDNANREDNEGSPDLFNGDENGLPNGGQGHQRGDWTEAGDGETPFG